jgi:hypothetical protein
MACVALDKRIGRLRQVNVRATGILHRIVSDDQAADRACGIIDSDPFTVAVRTMAVLPGTESTGPLVLS